MSTALFSPLMIFHYKMILFVCWCFCTLCKVPDFCCVASSKSFPDTKLYKQYIIFSLHMYSSFRYPYACSCFLILSEVPCFKRPTSWKGGERIYTPEQISQDPHAMQVYVQLKRIMQTTNGRGRGWISSWSGILQKTRGVMEQKQSSWNKSIIYSIHLKGKVIFSKCGNCAVESRRHF